MNNFDEIVTTINKKYRVLLPELSEQGRRLFAGVEAITAGWGGISAVARATGLSRTTVARGVKDAENSQRLESGRIRKKGGGRKRRVQTDPTLRKDLEVLLEPHTRGDPESPLRWTSKSVRKLAMELKKMGHKTSHRMVASLLREMDYSLQANRKTTEGKQHPDRDAQFKYINRKAKKQQKMGLPVISVDTKKKELVGDFKNAGQEWRPQGDPEKVRSHDFMDKELGKVSPYGVYDLTRNNGWVSVDIDHDTAAFAVATIEKWWRKMGSRSYPKSSHLLITADGGGSNSSRSRLWKVELQKLASRTGLTISVCHFPPGTSKWNKIEHRMFSFITKNWRGKPLVDRATIVSLIGSTKTEKGLEICCELDTTDYPKGIKVSDSELSQVKLKRHKFHGDWNYTITPKIRNI